MLIWSVLEFVLGNVLLLTDSEVLDDWLRKHHKSLILVNFLRVISATFFSLFTVIILSILYTHVIPMEKFIQKDFEEFIETKIVANHGIVD